MSFTDSEDFQPDSGFAATAAASDKWVGEDEDDGVKVGLQQQQRRRDERISHGVKTTTATPFFMRRF